MTQWTRGLGPGLLVTAAFIGPGTVFTASQAGARFGLELLWAALFSVFAAMVLQEMSARLGVVTRMGLGEAIRDALPQPVLRVLAMILVVSAIAIGNAAFQYGNITGAVAGVGGALGIDAGTLANKLVIIAVTLIALALLATGSVKAIQVALSGLVALMSLVFIVTALLMSTDWSGAAAGLVPHVPAESLVLVVGLIGTTVVPYNLFLQSSAARERWLDTEPRTALREARIGTFVAIAIGGLITLSILFVAAGAFPKGTVLDRARVSTEMLGRLGNAGRWLFALGLFSAGLTSAVTAPLAAAYATSGIVGFSKEKHPWAFRGVWLAVLAIGAGCALFLTASPAAGIVFAQAANGVILPLLAMFLLWMVNRRSTMGEFANGLVTNLLAGTVILVAVVLSYQSLSSAYAGLLKLIS